MPTSKELARDYSREPTLANYVRLRRLYPDIQFSAVPDEDPEFLLRFDDLEVPLVCDQTTFHALTGDPDAISELSLCLLEELIERDKIEKAGHSHVVSRDLAISDQTVRTLAIKMLCSLRIYHIDYIPQELLVLLNHLMGNPAENRLTLESLESKRRTVIGSIVVSAVVSCALPSYRSISKQLGVSPSTVTRWLTGEDKAAIQSIARALSSHEFRDVARQTVPEGESVDMFSLFDALTKLAVAHNSD